MVNHLITKGKVVLVPFPFDDLSTTKVRPAVYLTNPIGSHQHVILAFVTSRIPLDLMESDIVIDTLCKDLLPLAWSGITNSSTTLPFDLIRCKAA